MQLDYSAMFRNKLIESGEYMAQVVFVQAVTKPDGSTALYVEIELGNNESRYDGTRLTAILQPTSKGQRFIDAFEESYRVSPANLQEAVGRWASVYVYESLYKGTSFGGVKFHRQVGAAKEKAATLEEIKYAPIPAALPVCRSGIVDWEEVQSDPSTHKLDSDCS